MSRFLGDPFDDANFGFGGGGDILNRSCWAEKSAAAMRRENQAKQLFKAFYDRCSQMIQIRLYFL